MSVKQVLAFDFGASSGRAMVAGFDGAAISLKEVYRFANEPVSAAGTLYWDALRLLRDVKQGMLLASREGFESIGVDTWGVDFALLDGYGSPICNPVHYRDGRNNGLAAEFRKLVPDEELYGETGVQMMDINTLYQLFWLAQNQPKTLERAETLLMMPDLFVYLLTGKKQSEYTAASTSALLDVNRRDWALGLAEKAGIPSRLFAPIVQPGAVAGMLQDDICAELNIKPVPVIAVAEHDTQSAIAAIPSESDDFLFISCGTWALMGTHALKANVSAEALAAGFSNEGGFAGGISFLTNITGTWLIQECRRQWTKEGGAVSYDELDAQAEASPPFAAFIDPASPDFMQPGDMPRRIADYCKKTGQKPPETRGAIMRCIFESLSFTYRRTKERIERLVGKKYPCIHLVGGGVKSPILCQMTADACGVPVVAGPVEAAALGNAGLQLISAGAIKDIAHLRQVVRKSPDVRRYECKNAEAFDAAYEAFIGGTSC